MSLLDNASNPNSRKVRISNLQSLSQLHVLFQRSHIVETEPFVETFGPKAQRKRPRIEVGTFEELSKLGAAAADKAENAATSSGQSATGTYLCYPYLPGP